MHPVAGHGVRWVSAGPFVASSRRLRSDTAFPPALDPSKVFSSSAAVPGHPGLLPPHRLFHRPLACAGGLDLDEPNSPATGLPPCTGSWAAMGCSMKQAWAFPPSHVLRAVLTPQYAAGQRAAAQAVSGLGPSPSDAGLPLAAGLLRSHSVASSVTRDRSAGHPLAQPVRAVKLYRCEGLPCVSRPPCARGTMLRASPRVLVQSEAATTPLEEGRHLMGRVCHEGTSQRPVSSSSCVESRVPSAFAGCPEPWAVRGLSPPTNPS